MHVDKYATCRCLKTLVVGDRGVWTVRGLHSLLTAVSLNSYAKSQHLQNFCTYDITRINLKKKIRMGVRSNRSEPPPQKNEAPGPAMAGGIENVDCRRKKRKESA